LASKHWPVIFILSLAGNLVGGVLLVHRLTTRPAPTRGVYAETRRSLLDALAIPPDAIVMVGASQTERGEWAELLGSDRVVNRGVSGDTARDVLARLAPIVASGPRAVVLDVGGNDLAEGRTVEEVVGSYGEILARLRAGTPDVRVVVTSVLPVRRELYRGKVERARDVAALNRALRTLARDRGAMFLDVAALLVDGEGELAREYTLDGIHLTGRGYVVWADALRPHVMP
jgi:lysophospholipase L1-like esterase